MQQEYVNSALARVPTWWPEDWVNHFGHSVLRDAASPANHSSRRELWPAVFRPKAQTNIWLLTLHTATLSSNWFVLKPCSYYYLPFSNRCVICGFDIQTVWIFFQFIGKDTKKPTVESQPCVMPLKIQLINGESPLRIVFVEPLLKWLKGLSSSQVGCSGCCCCSCPIAVCFSLVGRASCLFPAALANLLLFEIRALALALIQTVGWEGGPALCEADPSLQPLSWAKAKRTSLVHVLCLPWPWETQPPLLAAGTARISSFTADSWALARDHCGPLARAPLRVLSRPVKCFPQQVAQPVLSVSICTLMKTGTPRCPGKSCGLMIAQRCASTCWSPLMHKRLWQNKYWRPPERSVPQNAALGCITEQTDSGHFTDSCREGQHQVHGQGWEALETPAFRGLWYHQTELLLSCSLG